MQLQKRAFTLIELLVVISIIALLIAILLPALSRAKELAVVTQCLSNQRQINVASITIGTDNKSILPSCKQDPGLRWVQIVFREPEWRRYESYGVIPDFFNDPGRNFNSYTNASNGGPGDNENWVISYQYFGGMEYWNNAQRGIMKSRSPINLDDMSSEMALTGDAMIKINGQWGGDISGGAYSDVPPHYSNGSEDPRGGNQTFADGSGGWQDFRTMSPLSSWLGFFARQPYWFQEDTGDFVVATP